jgi:hypothetical protein
MGEVVRVGQYIIRVYSNENRHIYDPHVHVIWADGEAKVRLAPLEIDRVSGDTAGKTVEIKGLVCVHINACWKEWQRCHENR